MVAVQRRTAATAVQDLAGRRRLEPGRATGRLLGALRQGRCQDRRTGQERRWQVISGGSGGSRWWWRWREARRGRRDMGHGKKMARTRFTDILNAFISAGVRRAEQSGSAADCDWAAGEARVLIGRAAGHRVETQAPVH